MSGIRGKRYIDEDGNEVLTGGLKAAATNKARNGEDFFKRIGKIGGRNSHTGGFYSNPELAREMGKTAGRISKRGFKYLGIEGGYRKYLDKKTGKVVKYLIREEIRRSDV